MRSILSFLALTLLFAACKTEDDSAPCTTTPAAAGLAFRLVDNGGNDLLRGGRNGVEISQPCRTGGTLEPLYPMYPIAGGTDSATILGFRNLETPEYGTGLGECYRIYFRFPGGDEDTVDWHYRLDGTKNCKQPTIDYMSYNGLQAVRESAFGRAYYRLVKR